MEMEAKIDKAQSCRQCGKCCNQGSLWLMSDHPLVRRIRDSMIHQEVLGEFVRDSGPCDMLALKNGKTVCLLHQMLGKEAKPVVCQEFWHQIG
jgi:hypothetical protein